MMPYEDHFHGKHLYCVWHLDKHGQSDWTEVRADSKREAAAKVLHWLDMPQTEGALDSTVELVDEETRAIDQKFSPRVTR